MNDGLIAPNEFVAALGHSSEKIHVLAARAELSAKGFSKFFENVTPEENVARAAFSPVHKKTGGMDGAVMEFSLFYPVWRLLLI